MQSAYCILGKRTMPVKTSFGHDLSFNVDIVMCIDATGSMSPIISEVKKNALSFYQKFVEGMEERDSCFDQLRIKVIAFKDFEYDLNPMVESKFFVMGKEDAEFRDFVNGIEASGGGDCSENSLEALALAMKSDWVRTGAIRRHVIIMYTDAPALQLSARANRVGYLEDMPKDLEELTKMWEVGCMEKRAKRLLIFAPDCAPWSEIGMEWYNTFHTESKLGAGCDDTDIETLIQLIAGCI